MNTSGQSVHILDISSVKCSSMPCYKPHVTFSGVQIDLHILNSDLLIFCEVLPSPRPNIYDVGIHGL